MSEQDINNANIDVLYNILSNEFPQTLAVVCSQLSTDRAKDLLSRFDGETRVDVIDRISKLKKVPIENLTEVKRIIDMELARCNYQFIDGESLLEGLK